MKKKLSALILAAALLLTMTGCYKINNPFADTSYAMVIDGQRVPAGVYIYCQYEASSDAAEKLRELYPSDQYPDANPDAEGFDYSKYPIDGKPYLDWIRDRAVFLTARLYAADKLFAERGLSFTEEEQQTIKTNIGNRWETDWLYDMYGEYVQYFGDREKETYAEMYTKAGISKESFSLASTLLAKEDKIYESMYGADGTDAVPDAEWRKVLQEDYVRYRKISMSIKDGDGVDLPAEDLAELEKLGKDYTARLAEGESFTAIKEEYQTYLDEKAETSEEEEISEEEAEIAEEEEISEEEAAEAEEETGEAEEEADENKNDYITKNDGEDEIVKKVAEMELNKPEFYKTETEYCVLVRLDIMEREDLYDRFRENIVYDLKYDGFKEMLGEKADALLTSEVKLNDAAIKRYDPRRIK